MPSVFNALVIRVYDPSDTATPGDAFLGAITIITGVGMLTRHYFYSPTLGLQAPYVGAAPVFGPDSITLNYNDTAPGSPENLETALGLNTGVNYDFRLDIDTYGDSELDAVTGGAGSTQSTENPALPKTAAAVRPATPPPDTTMS